jgi:carbon-monoxide dehydrogenase large subunit
MAAEVAFYAAREAMRNAARHGRGGSQNRPLHLTIEALWRDGLRLTIEDDGVGVGNSDASGGSGQGLALHGTMMAGSYATPAIYCEVKGVFTHTVPVDAYRGAGRPEAAFLVERIVDCAAVQLGMDAAEIRRKNFIQPEAFPYASPVGLTYDSGNYEATLDLGLKASDYAGFAARRAESKSRGKLRGIGLSTYVEACGIAPSAVVGSLGARAGLYESGIVRVHPTGSVTLFTGAHSHGQGHETAFAQLAAEYLGVPIAQVDVVTVIRTESHSEWAHGCVRWPSEAAPGQAIRSSTRARSPPTAGRRPATSVQGQLRVVGTDKARPSVSGAGRCVLPHTSPGRASRSRPSTIPPTSPSPLAATSAKSRSTPIRDASR